MAAIQDVLDGLAAQKTLIEAVNAKVTALDATIKNTGATIPADVQAGIDAAAASVTEANAALEAIKAL